MHQLQQEESNQSQNFKRGSLYLPPLPNCQTTNHHFHRSNIHWVSVPMPYQIYLLLLPVNDELDGPTIMELMYDVLLDGFHLMDDIVVVEYEPVPAVFNTVPRRQPCVSITYENEWRCQIHFNNNTRQVLSDSQRWARLYATDLSIEVRNNIANCRRRLDITTDPDAQRDYFDDFYALLDHLRNTIGPCYVFDPTRNEFLI